MIRSNLRYNRMLRLIVPPSHIALILTKPLLLLTLKMHLRHKTLAALKTLTLNTTRIAHI
jgi:hypothetical protein